MGLCLPACLVWLVICLLLTNHDVHEKTIAKGCDVNHWDASVFIFVIKNVTQETTRMNDGKPIGAEPIRSSFGSLVN
jgi:hypothetical protein